MYEVNICPSKYRNQISLCEANPLGSLKVGIPGEMVLGEDDSCQMWLFLECRVKGTVTLLAPACVIGSFACVMLTGCVWHWRLCETHVRTELFVNANTIDGLVKQGKFTECYCFFSREASPLSLPY